MGLDFGGYNLISNNCEHFANWCVTGVRQSMQSLNVNPNDDKRDIVEKEIDNVVESVLKLGKLIDNIFDR